MRKTQTPSLRFSIVIPTFNRRDLVVRCVESLARQSFTGRYEVVVVVDGSTDDTADALRGLRTPMPFKVIEQANGGCAAARNRGADESTGELLMFLDDDMEADEGLLAAHDASHRAGADIVIGDIPLHPDSPDSAVSHIVGQWAKRRRNRLIASGDKISVRDMLCGQVSLPRSLFFQAGGFDSSFTSDGGFGNEDIDFSCRLMKMGCRIVFNPQAISRQRVIVELDAFLKRSQALGKADVHLARKHPVHGFELLRANGVYERSGRLFWRPLQHLPFLAALLAKTLQWLAVSVIEARPKSRRSRRLFNLAWWAGYWRGIGVAGGLPRPARTRVLAYHAISDLRNVPAVEKYSVPPSTFARQLDLLLSAGCTFISGDELTAHLIDGSELPERPILLTFDDCYTDLHDTVLPLLTERRIPAIAFAVAGQIGGVNAWDQAPGCRPLALLSAEGLRLASAGGIEIGAHSKTHRRLHKIDHGDIGDETVGAIDELERQGLPRPRFFAYPHGMRNKKVVDALSGSGIVAAFTVDLGMASVENDPFQLPRIEILRRHKAGLSFIFRVAAAGLPVPMDRDSLRLVWDVLTASWRGKSRPTGRRFRAIKSLRMPRFAGGRATASNGVPRVESSL